MTYKEIGERVGFCAQTVMEYGQQVLPGRLQGYGMRKIKRAVTPEQLARWREQRLSYRDIAAMTGFSSTSVADYAREVLPAELIQARGYGAWASKLASADDGTRPAEEVGEELGCPAELVTYWRKRRARERKGRCRRCGLLAEERNPVEDGLCLWCRLELEGVDLLEWHESGAAVEALGAEAITSCCAGA